MPTRYVAYARVSTSEQAERGKSIEDQLAKLSREAPLRGGVLVKTFADPGFSGSLLKRPQLTALLEFCRKGGADAVLVVDTDRLARKTEHHFLIKAQLKTFGVHVESLNQPMIDDTPEGVFLDTILAATNALYPQITGRKTSLSMAEKAAAGWWPGPARLGYRNVDNPAPTSANDRRIIVPHAAAGPLVTQAFALYATGQYSLQSLCRKMEMLGLRTTTGGKVTTTSMRKMLGDSFYYSRAIYKGQMRSWKHAPLTDEETFQQCQLVLMQHNRYADRMRKHDFLLSGLVRCGLCGATYTASVNAEKGKAYYHCPLNQGHPHSNVGQNVAVEVLDAQAEALLEHISFERASVDYIISKARALLAVTHEDVDEKRRELLAQKAKVENRRQKLELKYLDDEVTQEMYRRQSEGLEETLTTLSLEITRLDLSRDTNIGLFEQLMRMSTGFQAAFASSPPALQRAYLSLCFETIIVQDRQIIEAIPTPLFGMALKMTTSRLEAEEKASSLGTKKSLSFQVAEGAGLSSSDAVQSSEAVIKIEGWLPSPSEFITFLGDLAYWSRVNEYLYTLPVGQ
jgi:site-specific DNA recombinase